MANNKFEQQRARAILASIAPPVDDVSALHFEQLADTIFNEAKARGMNDQNELLSASLHAIARKYFSDPRRSDRR